MNEMVEIVDGIDVGKTTNMLHIQLNFSIQQKHFEYPQIFIFPSSWSISITIP